MANSWNKAHRSMPGIISGQLFFFFFDEEKESNWFPTVCALNQNKIFQELLELEYAKSISCEAKLDGKTVEDTLNPNKNVSTLLRLTDAEIGNEIY